MHSQSRFIVDIPQSPQNSPPKPIPTRANADGSGSAGSSAGTSAGSGGENNSGSGGGGGERTEEVMESALVEIAPAGECYSLNIISTRLQRVQFLSSDAKATHFLFIL